MTQQSGEDRFLNVWFYALCGLVATVVVIIVIEIIGDDGDGTQISAVTTTPTAEATATQAEEPTAEATEAESTAEPTAEPTEAETSPPAVVNDLIEDALPLGETRSLEIDTTEATISADDPVPSCAAGEPGNSVWFRFDSTGLETGVFDTRGSDHDTVVSAYSGDQPDLAEVACDDNSGGDDGTSVLFLRGLPEQSYVVFVSGVDTPGGSLSLDFVAGTFDERDFALPIRGVVDLTANTSDATAADTDPEPSCADSAEATVWWGLISETAGTMSIDTAGSDYDTVVAVFARQEDQSLVEVACNDDAGDSPTSQLEVDVDPLVAYFVMVAGKEGGGSLTINIEAPQ
jgi:hypothetical protein